jgi:hypothetical protein
LTEANDSLGEALSPPFDEAVFLRHLGDPARMAPFIDFVMRRLLASHHHGIFWGDRMLTLDKAMGFLGDPAFTAAWEQVRGAHDYDQYDTRQSIAWRMNTLVWAAKTALRLPKGDFVECGVFQGDMSLVVLLASGLLGSGRRLHLFDSFVGIDPARLTDGEYADFPNYVEMANSHYRKSYLHESVVARFAPYAEVSVHKGFLPEGLEGRAPERIAWLHIDLNTARPEVETLAILFDRIVPGGLIVLDDYGWLPFKAQRDAEDIFFAERGYAVLELPTGQGLVVKRP